MNSELPARETIRLDQFLKICQLVETGGQAKLLIQGGEVLVNGATLDFGAVVADIENRQFEIIPHPRDHGQDFFPGDVSTHLGVETCSASG